MKKLKNRKKKSYKDRIWELDFIRGLCIILMMLFHMGVALVLFGEIWYYFADDSSFLIGLAKLADSIVFSELVDVDLREFVVPPFFIIAGLSAAFSKNIYKSFIKTTLFALVISAVTYAAAIVAGDDFLFISHGVFHIFAACYLVYMLFCLAVRDKYVRSGLFLSLAIFGFVVLNMTNRGLINWPPTLFWSLIFQNAGYGGFWISALDSYTLLPWISWFFIGAAVSPYLYGNKKSLLPKLNRKWHLPVSFIGRYPIQFYAGHMVVVILLLIILTFVFLGPEWLTALG
ncbi:MAG: DUF1624 domain-containing protein [Clostridiales bacterium]|nr:DUF1624 domain-containing protein [Clostridiales bacterium]